MITAWIVGIGFGAIILAVGVLVYIGWRSYDPDVDVTHSLDCLDWSRFGLTDPDCNAIHTTDHFATPRDAVELTGALDGQLSIGEKK